MTRKEKHDISEETRKEDRAPSRQELEEEISRLRAQLAEKEKEATENYDRFLRAMAELDNFRKRTGKEKEELVKFANEELLRDILPLIDNLDRALNHAEASSNFSAFREGLMMARDQLLRTLAGHGLAPIECVNQSFDPNYHEAMMTVESPDHDDNQVVDELEKGYLFHGRLLRPAKVSVCKKKERAECGD